MMNCPVQLPIGTAIPSTHFLSLDVISFCIMKLFCIFWSVIIVANSIVHAEESAAASEKYAFCGDCWCIPDDNGEGVCPHDDMPPTEFSDTLLENLRGMTHENPLELNCDPYRRSRCDTVPALETGGVCAASIKSNDGQCPQDFSYT